MANNPFVVLCISLCVVLSGCLAQRSQFNECQLDSINALEPDHRVESEGGLTETWNANRPELRCAGVSVVRRTIQPQGLHVPSYVPAPQLHFIVQGGGLLGISIPGCAETYEKARPSASSRRRGWSRKEQEQEQQPERHQKIRHIREGEIVAIPTGVPYWTYNNRNSPLIAITLIDTTNTQNQLDRNPRRFYLAGSPKVEHPESQQQKQQRNVFSGFDRQLLKQAFNIDEETASRLQSSRDHQGSQIVRVRGGLSMVIPRSGHGQQQEEEEEEEQHGRQGSRGRSQEEEEEEEQTQPRHRGQRQTEEEEEWEGQGERRRPRRQRGQSQEEGEEWRGQRGQSEREWGCGNSLEETVCSLKLHQNIGSPREADLYNPRAGRISTINSLDLPILKWLKLSAEWVVLYRNGIYAPHWNINANSVIYVTRGRGRVQIVNCEGKAVFNGAVRRGQLLVVPQNFAVAKQAGSEGLEYIAFKTNDRAMISPLVGRTSVFKAIPAQVLANAFGIRQHQVSSIKYARDEQVLISPASQSRESLIVKV